MATKLTAKDLTKMDTAALRREIAERQMVIAKMRLEIELGSRKDTAAYRVERRNLARLETALSQAGRATSPASTLNRRTKRATLTAPANA
jgi:ribosomal protein L29